MRFARWVFLLAGIVGLLLTVPPFFLEEQMGKDHPPPVNHPELYYGFFGLCLAWQLVFLVIASDPVRLRPVMPPAMVEKASYVAAIFLLYARGRVDGAWLGFASLDALWLVLFAVAYWRTRTPAAPAP